MFSSKAEIWKSALIFIFSTLFILFVYYLGKNLQTDQKIWDSFFKIKKNLQVTQDVSLDQYIVIEVDDKTYRNLGKQFPVSRTIYAEFLDKVASFNPKVIIIDSTIVGESNISKDEDRLLEDVIRNAKNVILSFYYDQNGTAILPLKDFAFVSAGIGFIDTPQDKDGVLRRSWLFKRDLNGKIVSFSLAVRGLAYYLSVPFEEIYFSQDKGLRLGDKLSVPVQRNGLLNIPFFIKRDDCIHISFVEVIQNQITGEMLKDKIVLVGNTSIIKHDHHRTPLGEMPGVYIILNQIAGYYEGINYVHVSIWFELILCLSVLLLGLWIFQRIHVLYGLITAISISFIILMISYLFFINGLLIQLSFPIFILWFLFFGTSIYRYTSLLYQGIRLKDLAVRDPLTSLYTQKYLLLKLNTVSKQKLLSKDKVFLLIMNVQNFSSINEQYSFETGDLLLKWIAQILIKNLKESTIAREGIDQFVILKITDEQDIKNIISCVITALNNGFTHHNLTIPVKAIICGVFSEIDKLQNAQILYPKATHIAQYISKNENEFLLVSADNVEIGHSLQKDKSDRKDLLIKNDFDYVAYDLIEKNERLQKNMHELIRIQKEKIKAERLAAAGLITAKFSHELKNPLASLRICVEVMKESLDDKDNLVKYFDIIKNEIVRLADLSKQMLDFFKSPDEAFALCDINEIIIYVSELINKKCLQSNIEIKVHGDENLQLCYVAKNQIKQVVLNLTLNAMDAMTNGGKLTICTKQESKEVTIEIEDTGTGIPKEILNRLFDGFYSTKTSGTGLGLMTSFDIIKHHNGSIDVESELGKGTKVIVKLKNKPETYCEKE
ncbi:MAG: CHASE2 domain-containing protein [Chlamydiota bacterium]|nr:CHASE2 domain-containing protein [Chlamydiota bacterium]